MTYRKGKAPLSVREAEAAMVGELVFVMTATLYYAGVLLGADDDGVVLGDPWTVFSTGKLSDFLATGVARRAEQHDGPRLVIYRGCMITTQLVLADSLGSELGPDDPDDEYPVPQAD